MHRRTLILAAFALLPACAGDPAAPAPDAGDGPAGVTELARGNFSVRSLAVDATHAYFSGRAATGVSVYRVPLAGWASRRDRPSAGVGARAVLEPMGMDPASIAKTYMYMMDVIADAD